MQWKFVTYMYGCLCNYWWLTCTGIKFLSLISVLVRPTLTTWPLSCTLMYLPHLLPVCHIPTSTLPHLVFHCISESLPATVPGHSPSDGCQALLVQPCLKVEVQDVEPAGYIFTRFHMGSGGGTCKCPPPCLAHEFKVPWVLTWDTTVHGASTCTKHM